MEANTRFYRELLAALRGDEAVKLFNYDTSTRSQTTIPPGGKAETDRDRLHVPANRRTRRRPKQVTIRRAVPRSP